MQYCALGFTLTVELAYKSGHLGREACSWLGLLCGTRPEAPCHADVYKSC